MAIQSELLYIQNEASAGREFHWLPVIFLPARQRTRSADCLEGHMRSTIVSAAGKEKQPRGRSVSGPYKLSAISGGRGATTIPVLVVSTRNDDHRQVRESLEKGRWLVVEARNWSAAMSLSQCLVFPVIVCDRDMPGPDGNSTFRSLTGGWRTASVVLLTDQWDADLWESVLQQGGFDVLMRPLLADDVLAVLETAYRQWVDGRPSAAVSAESSRSRLTRSRTAS
jgi:PleD family two-component response regulator